MNIIERAVVKMFSPMVRRMVESVLLQELEEANIVEMVEKEIDEANIDRKVSDAIDDADIDRLAGDAVKDAVEKADNEISDEIDEVLESVDTRNKIEDLINTQIARVLKVQGL